MRNTFMRVISAVIRREHRPGLQDLAGRNFMGIVMRQPMRHVKSSEGNGQSHRNARASQPGTCKTHWPIM